jgi:hypothetical protein
MTVAPNFGKKQVVIKYPRETVTVTVTVTVTGYIFEMTAAKSRP